MEVHSKPKLIAIFTLKRSEGKIILEHLLSDLNNNLTPLHSNYFFME